MSSIDHSYGTQTDSHIDSHQGKNQLDYYNQIYLVSYAVVEHFDNACNYLVIFCLICPILFAWWRYWSTNIA